MQTGGVFSFFGITILKVYNSVFHLNKADIGGVLTSIGSINS